MPVFAPIVFVHGWGGVTDFVRDFNEADERDPYVGWNDGHRYNDPEGWVKFRDTQPNFEGLVLRLVKDFGYYDASNDDDLAELKLYLGQPPAGAAARAGLRDPAPEKSLWIFRYYEYAAEHLSLSQEALQGIAAELARRGYTASGPPVGLPYYAALLALQVERIACARAHDLHNWGTGEPTCEGLGLEKVCLVGHSMGGLIARFALQYNLFGIAPHVSRLMTLATPHGGARYASPVRILRWLPGLRNDDVTFLDPDWVSEHLGGQDASWDAPDDPRRRLPLPRTDVFCLVGTRHEGYYPIARRLPRTDGIVHQDEAYLRAYPYAYVHNTHSGEHGIRENHDGYQSLRRFLFGDLRVQIQLTDIRPKTGLPRGERYFFHYYVKPRGINAHLNEISERSENQPKPRTVEELQQAVQSGRYLLYDGFADTGAMVEREERRALGVTASQANKPHFQLEFGSFAEDRKVGAKPLGAGFVMVPLTKGETEITLKDQAFTATAKVVVSDR